MKNTLVRLMKKLFPPTICLPRIQREDLTYSADGKTYIVRQRRATGDKDDVASERMYICRALAPWLQHAMGGIMSCQRCGVPWPIVEFHTTWVDNSGSMPLCEYCWKELAEGKKRWPYYLQLFDGHEQAYRDHPDGYPEDYVAKKQLFVEQMKQAVVRYGG